MLIKEITLSNFRSYKGKVIANDLSNVNMLFEANDKVTPAKVKESPFLKTLTYSVAIKENGIVDEEVRPPT